LMEMEKSAVMSINIYIMQSYKKTRVICPYFINQRCA
jgi:hypothetical protein